MRVALEKTVSVRPLFADDAPAFLALAARCNTGTEAFRVDRAPDPFALGRSFGPTTTYGVFSGGTLVATGAVSTQTRYLGGRARELSYLHDLRVDPDHRRLGITRALSGVVVPHLLANERPILTTVLHDNPLRDIIVHGLSRHFGAEKSLGDTSHFIAAPPSEGPCAREISCEEFERVYQARPKRGFACAEERVWRQSAGRFLLFEDQDHVAVAKLVDESRSRRFLAHGAPISLGTLSFLGEGVSSVALDAFLAASREFDLVAFGAASGISYPLAQVAVASSTFAFRLPSPEPLLAHELILI